VEYGPTSNIHAYATTVAELAWQKERLGSLSAALVATTEPDQTITQILSGTVRLLRAETAALSLYDPVQGRFRVAAITGPQSHLPRWSSIAFEAPRELLTHAGAAVPGMRVLPDDDPNDPLAPALIHAHSCALYVVLRYGAEVIGILTVLRAATDAFDANDRLLARGIGDQAALALATARMQDDLLRARASRAEVFGIISYEFRTPLNAILGFTELLRHSAASPGETARYTARIDDASRSLLQAVEEILAFGNLVTDHAEADVKAIAFRQWWANGRETCERLPRGPAVGLDWQDDVPDVTVITDATKVGSVLAQLVGNALKFTERGTVHVGASVSELSLVLRVSDTGSGILAMDRDRIFEPFWQADSSTTRRHGGMGLGLYVVQRYVALLGGTLTLQSSAHGSVFTVMLPAVIASSSMPSERPDRFAGRATHDGAAVVVA
jgi:signal transduction histidine kinase